MARVMLTEELRAEYRDLFARARIRPERRFEVQRVVERIFAPGNWARYRAVEARTGVPAHIVGILHSLECGLRFDAHLHNGDPLTARTVRVPAGHPAAGAPPFDWAASAADALQLRRLHQQASWGLEDIAHALEGYNGFGYRLHHPQVKSPYLWSFTTAYSAGKYVADGTWSDTAVSQQCGAMALLRAMLDSGRIQLALPPATPPAEEPDAAVVTPRASAAALALLAPAAPPPFPGRLLRLDSRGEAVTTLQRRLLALGITQLGAADGDFGEKTQWAVKQFQARSVDEAGVPLEVDGIVGARTWRALFGVQTAIAQPAPEAPAPGSIADRVLRIAAAEVGTMEDPPGSNSGAAVNRYQDSVGPGLHGQPWCMAFVHWCLQQAGAGERVPRTASVWRSWELAPGRPGVEVVTAQAARRDPALVRPGMVFYLDTGGRSGHCGFVADVQGNSLVTIEGNTNDGGSREGIGVFIRNGRRLSQINLGFVSFG